jgi:hypothetical protein
MQYGEIFTITAWACVLGAVLGLLIAGKHDHADEPEDVGLSVDDASTQRIEAPTQQLSRQNADQTARITQPPGRHRSG